MRCEETPPDSGATHRLLEVRRASSRRGGRVSSRRLAVVRGGDDGVTGRSARRVRRLGRGEAGGRSLIRSFHHIHPITFACIQSHSRVRPITFAYSRIRVFALDSSTLNTHARSTAVVRVRVLYTGQSMNWSIGPFLKSMNWSIGVHSFVSRCI